jgi:hypothetical protein
MLNSCSDILHYVKQILVCKCKIFLIMLMIHCFFYFISFIIQSAITLNWCSFYFMSKSLLSKKKNVCTEPSFWSDYWSYINVNVYYSIIYCGILYQSYGIVIYTIRVYHHHTLWMWILALSICTQYNSMLQSLSMTYWGEGNWFVVSLCQ